MNLSKLNISLFLTLIRLILSPLLLPILLAIYLPEQSFKVNIWLSLFFLALSLTDFFDGFFARHFDQKTPLGETLDPIADKFLLFSSLITLVYFHKIHFYWAIIFISREFFIMALRYTALTQGIRLNVTTSAKYKTTFQMSYIFWAILNPYQNFGLTKAPIWNIIEYLLLFISLYLTIWTGIQYFVSFISQQQKRI